MKKIFLVWLVIITAVFGGYLGADVVIRSCDPPSAVKVVSDNMQSLVYLEIYAGHPTDGIYLAGSASGVVISEDGLIATARHVTEYAVQIKVFLQDGREFIVDDLDYFEKGDLGLIKIPKVRNLKTAKLGDYDSVRVGEQVVVMGSPLGIRDTITFGIVSHTKRESSYFSEYPLLQLDAAAYPGNSGGPIFNLNGELIGILVGGRRGAECLNLGMTVRSLKDYLDAYEESLS